MFFGNYQYHSIISNSMKIKFLNFLLVPFLLAVNGCITPEPTSPDTNAPFNPQPSSGEGNIQLAVTLAWENNSTDTYDVYFDTKNPPAEVIVKDTTSNSVVVTGLSYSITYYWKVVAKSTSGKTKPGPVWHFTTKDQISNTPGYELTNHLIETRYPCFVNIMFQVTDMDGFGVKNFTKDDFIIKENYQTISPTESALNIRQKDAVPYTLKTVLMIDNSSSVAADLETIKSSAITLINSIVPKQEIAVYKFSESIVKVQDFTTDRTILTSAINSIDVGFPSTNLYGAVITGVSLWEEFYNLNDIQQGFMLLITDGRDTQSSHTLSEALSKRGNKKIFTIGLGNEIDPEALSILGNAGFVSINDVTLLSQKFTEIQKQIDDYANSFYLLNYMSPKRGNQNHTLQLSLKDNPYSGSGSILNGQFNSAGFASAAKGIFINVSNEKPNGIDTVYLRNNEGYSVLAESFMAINMPVFEWSSDNSSVAVVFPDPIINSRADIVAVGEINSSTTIKVKDINNSLEKEILVLVTGKNYYNQIFDAGVIPYNWSTGGETKWNITSETKVKGEHSAKSGSISNNQTSYLRASYNVPAGSNINVSFYRKVSSEENFDELLFYVNDVKIASWSGETGWEKFTYQAVSSSSILELKWIYKKDDKNKSGSDCCWIDDVNISW